MNVVALVGRTTKELEVNYTATNVAVCNFTLAVNRNFKNQEGEYEADFINCVAFGSTAQRMEQYVRKGSQIAVNGRVQTRNYENREGQRVYVTEIVTQSVTFLDSRSKSNEAFETNAYTSIPAVSNQNNAIYEISDDDLPF